MILTRKQSQKKREKILRWGLKSQPYAWKVELLHTRLATATELCGYNIYYQGILTPNKVKASIIQHDSEIPSFKWIKMIIPSSGC